MQLISATNKKAEFMTTASTAPLAAPPPLRPPTSAGGNMTKKIGLILALVALLVIVLMPTPQRLPVAGQAMLGILVFAVNVWMT